MRIAALVDETMAQGLRLAGAETSHPESRAVAAEELRSLLGDPEVGVVIIAGPASGAAAELRREVEESDAILLDLGRIEAGAA